MKPLYKITLLLSILLFASNYTQAAGLHYSVKINTNKDLKSDKLNQFSIQKETQGYVIAGSYPQYIEAMKAKQEIAKLGYSTIEIVAFFNHTLISIDDAFALMDNRNQQDQENNGYTLSEDELSEFLVDVQNNDFFYTVQIGLNTEQNINNFFDFPKQYDERITTKGNLRYTYGKFSTINDAKDALKMVKDYGLGDAFIIAFDQLERIPLDRAIEIEQQALNNLISLNN